MNVGQDLSCNAQHPTPVMEIHGTADATVPYEGGGFMEAIPNVLSYWVNFNNYNASPVITDVPNINTADGCTAVHYLYSGGTSGVDVEHYKIIDGGHTWPGSMFNIGVTNNDFNASKKIWQFFLQYDLNGRIQANGIADLATQEISVYPNPAIDEITIQGFSQKLSHSYCSLFSIEGKQFNMDLLENNTIDTSKLESGVYFVRIATREGVAAVQFVKV
jgi:polyhydroxybutyrate depolymerase